MRYYHGTSNTLWTAHEGACLVDDERIARSYARGGVVFTVEITGGLVEEEVEVTQEARAEMEYPGDRAAARRAYIAEGVDVLTYDDEDEGGRQHRCYRLLSPAAIAACTIVE